MTSRAGGAFAEVIFPRPPTRLDRSASGARRAAVRRGPRVRARAPERSIPARPPSTAPTEFLRPPARAARSTAIRHATRDTLHRRARARARARRIDSRVAAVDRVRPAQLWEASLESDVLGVLAVISFEWRDTTVYCHAVATSPAYRSRAGSSGSLQAGSRLVAFASPRFTKTFSPVPPSRAGASWPGAPSSRSRTCSWRPRRARTAPPRSGARPGRVSLLTSPAPGACATRRTSTSSSSVNRLPRGSQGRRRQPDLRLVKRSSNLEPAQVRKTWPRSSARAATSRRDSSKWTARCSSAKRNNKFLVSVGLLFPPKDALADDEHPWWYMTAR